MQAYIRLGIVNIEDVLPFATFKTRPRTEKEYLGTSIYMDSPRYQIFAKKGCTCVQCGIEGSYFAVEKNKNNKSSNPNRYHLNLYASTPEGEELLMTVDHIIPASKGGKRNITNLQPMCYLCNQIKGNN